MKSKIMQILSSERAPIENEEDRLLAYLPLDGASVLELGCGGAAKTRVIAQKAASVLALDVDEVQLAKNTLIRDLDNVVFEYGGAQQIPTADASIDLVLMFKSLHHVPVEHLDAAFLEIHRVLKTNGMLYISEPIFDGEFNEIIRLFNDEQTVRAAAFAATERAVSSGLLKQESQTFFLQPVHFDNFEQFENDAIKVTYASRHLSTQIHEEVRSRFDRYMTPSGADFLMPMRVDLLKKTA